MMYPRIILFILLPLFGFSQAPQKINFQSILRNSGGEVVSNKAVSLRISILSGSINDSTVYSETHTKTTDASGLISIQIGGGTVVSGIFGNISWGNAAHFIKLEADFNGGSNYVLLGTQEIMSVPYALYASKTDTSVLNLANRFNSKVNASDTASMLINYRNELNNKLNTSDTFFMLSNYWTGLNNKVSFSDTAAMLNPYLKKADVMVNVETDPVFNSSIAKGITGIDTAYWNRKLNVSDIASMLAPYFLDADTTLLNMEGRLSTKVSFSDTANMLNPYLKKADAMVNVETDPVFNTSIAKGITGIDTAYWNRKLNPSDTASMLTNYLRKSDAIIADLQNQDKLLQSLTNVVDIDGNSYKTLKIGQQTWMAENLKTTKYKNGEAIPTGLTDVAWSSTTNGAYAIYNNDVANDSMYGKLYNWYAVADSGGLCPAGWHVPSLDDWTILADHLGGLSVAGGKMKVKGTTYWNSDNVGATNESGFGALPGGDRDYLAGQFGGINHLGYFWSSTEVTETPIRAVLFKQYEFAQFGGDPKRDGFSVRCLKDSETDINQGLNLKLNISDTATMLNPYLKKADVMINVETDPVFNTSIAKGITGIDTAYWNRKLNVSDSASMLTNYLRKSDAIIDDLQNQDKLLQSLTNVVDIDGNSYRTLKIGQQTWMAENLKTTKYKNGEAIPTGLTDVAWSSTTNGAYAIYNNDVANDSMYGKLYNWYAVADSGGLCPAGWHVPTDAEWTILTDHLGGLSVAGGKMKVKGTTYWNSPNAGATNESGFGALPGGDRDYLAGQFGGINHLGYFWSSTELDQNLARRPVLYKEYEFVYRNQDPKRDGFSVRCLKDSETDINQGLNLKLNVSDTATMLNPYLKKADAMVNVETDPVFNTSIAKGITGIDTAYWNRKTGNSIGNIQYWNGTEWVNLAPGQDGQTLILVNGIPSWSGAAYPTLTTSSVSSITSTSAGVGGNISADGGASVSARGLVYGTASNPTLSNTILSIGSGTGDFSGTISGLTPNTTYYVRAYATNSAGTGYGNAVSFQTSPVAVPTLITTDASGITQTTVTSGGTISNDGGATVTERGIVYGTSTNPTTSDTKVASGSGTGSFSVNVTALTPNTTYHIRSYAINSAGTGYGNNITFQTTVPSVPSLSTRELLNITNTTATGGGSITNDGGSSISSKGICWGTSPNPTTLDNKTTDGTGTTSFTSFITGLSASVTYYVRSYATNSTGTGYGNQQTFTTSSTSNTLPVVTSTSVTELTTVQVTFNAEVNSQGGGTVTERGAVWNTSGNPTVNSNRVPSGSGTGVYTTTITGLSGASNYYVRAYAINNFGISYGVEIPFTTLIGLATLTTNNVIAQTTTASSGGIITDNGGSTVIARGVVWNTTGTPTKSDSKTMDGSGTGSYVSNMTALSPSTTYYVRSYATNSTGTAYGNEILFTTTDISQPVTDIDGNTYNTVQIGNQVWMSENLKTSRYRNGGSIPYVLGNADWGALTTGAWSNYDHDVANDAIYGKLYNWYTTLGDTLCPIGWHVPSDNEWTILTDYLGGESVAGGKMKSVGTDYWNDPNTGATNVSGFSVLPGGARDYNGSFNDIRNFAFFWSATEGGSNLAWSRYLNSSNGNLGRSFNLKSVGASIRCLKD